MNNLTNKKGFTLLEILIALFIFTILSTILVGALRSVIDAEAGTEKSAERLRDLQIALLIVSRDIEQTVNRPVLSASGGEEPAFMGSPNSFTFTHGGFANPTGASLNSSLQRTRYAWMDGALYRMTWSHIDLAPASKPHSRRLLTNAPDVHFQYLDKDGQFQNNWPMQSKEPLPRAVRVFITIAQWGKMSQLYVIPARPKTTPVPPPAAPSAPAAEPSDTPKS